LVSLMTLFAKLLNLACAILAGCIAAVGVRDLFHSHGSWQSAIVPVYLIALGIGTFILSLWWNPVLDKYLGFYRIWLGRGLFFIFIGALVGYNGLSSFNFDSAVAFACYVVGIICIIFHCITPAAEVDYQGVV